LLTFWPGFLEDVQGNMIVHSRLSEQINLIRLVIRLRWGGLGFIGVAALYSYRAEPKMLGVLVMIALAVASYNTIAYLHSLSIQNRKPFSWQKETRLALNMQIALDIVMVALAVYLTGGAYSALLAFFVVIIPAAGLVLSRIDTFIQATLALILLMVVVQSSVFDQASVNILALPLLSLNQSTKEFFNKVLIFQASFIYLGAYIAGYIRSQLDHAYQIEQRARMQAEALRKVAAALGSTLELSQVIDLVLKHLREFIFCDGASISLIEGDKIYMTESWGTDDPLYRFKPGVPWRNYALVRSVVFERKPVFDWDALLASTGGEGVQIRSRALLPLVIRDEVRGVLKVHATQNTIFDDKEIASLQALAGHIGLAVENSRLYERTRQMAITDGLTGLYNRTCFYQELERELARSRRHGHKLSLLICDLDHFKAYNDRYGHVAGDDLLRDLAAVFNSVVRKSDKTFRYGGEEFALILPETGSAPAMELAERLRLYVEIHEFVLSKQSQPTHITLSIGTATFPDQSQDLESLVEAADKALFLAKRERNRVCSLGDFRAVS
jgi:diguanylate cyclase (GGDEF)-like protein